MEDITIHIAGIIALLFTKDGQELKECVMGLVDGVPHHKPLIAGKKVDKQGVETEFTLDESVSDVQLLVENTTASGIRLFLPHEPIDRIAGTGSQDSSVWVLDLEAELYKKEIGVDPRKFHTIFRINNGEIFTEVISDNYLLCRSEADQNEPVTLIGKVATLVGMRVDLDLEQSVAHLTTDGNPVVDIAHGETLDMNVFLTCPDCDQLGQQSAHGNQYYRALGNKLVFGEKQIFSSTKMPAQIASPPISPEASCLVGRAGMSNPGG